MHTWLLFSRFMFATLLLLNIHLEYVAAIRTAPISSAIAAAGTTSSLSTGTCESRTINYITQTLPAICLRNGRYTAPSNFKEGPNITNALSASGLSEQTFTATTAVPTTTTIPQPASRLSVHREVEPVSGDEPGALDDTSFLSFEDWKKQKEERASYDGDRKKKDSLSETLEALGEDGDIDIDFGAFLGDHPPSVLVPASDEARKAERSAADSDLPAEKPKYRSKDAGKTCKERFNFASLDAGGQVMKANPEAKSASAPLSENRDYYMLNICQAKNKFLIIELSESILVETVAMANFEFFSSTFRQFRISVSDRYPQKLERWVELGTFEAKNSRDIQAFLVKDPRIWARYIRIEFLNHYGNEFYCPVSLLRVHGYTMIQDVLNMEKAARGEDDADEDSEDIPPENGDQLQAEAVSNSIEQAKAVAVGLKEAQTAIEGLVMTAEAIAPEHLAEAIQSSHIMDAKQMLLNATEHSMITPWQSSKSVMAELYNGAIANDICPASKGPASRTSASQGLMEDQNALNRISNVGLLSKGVDVTAESKSALQTSVGEQNNIDSRSLIAETKQIVSKTSTHAQNSGTSITLSPSLETQNASALPSDKVSRISTGHSSQPTTQESFFKTVTKRLQLLEANSTLSLKYIEEQSKILREAFTKVERRQLAKTTSFLEDLNNTVIAELRLFGHQYDQIWQSTVIELQSQRDQSQRELAAVSARLNILADELVFQKRMSIVQSVILLLCLGLVVFSRGIVGGYVDVPVIQSMLAKSRNNSNSSFHSPADRSAINHETSFREPDQARQHGHARQNSDESAGSVGSQSGGGSPQTPFSTYSRFEHEIENDEQGDPSGHIQSSLLDYRASNSDRHVLSNTEPLHWRNGDNIPDEAFIPSSQEASPAQSDQQLRHGEIFSAVPEINIRHHREKIHGTFGVDNLEMRAAQTSSSAIAHHVETDEGPTIVGSDPLLSSDDGKRDFVIQRKPLPPLPIESTRYT